MGPSSLKVETARLLGLESEQAGTRSKIISRIAPDNRKRRVIHNLLILSPKN